VPETDERLPMPRPPREITSVNLDLLRAVAVLCVFFAHLLTVLNIPSFGSLGRFGVVIFFVHTSFVLMESLERLETTAPSDLRLIQAFWIRRAFRIYPLAMFFVVLAAVFHVPASPGHAYTWIGTKDFIANFFLVQNIFYGYDILDPLWSLPLEVQMYVLLPFAYFAIRAWRHYYSIPLWLLSLFLASTLPYFSVRLNALYFAPCFTSGIVAYDLLRSRPTLRRLPAWLWPLAVVLVILLFQPHDNLPFYLKIYRAWFVSLLLGVLYACIKELPSGLPQRLFHQIAKYSYGIYLSHTVIFWFAIYYMHAAPLWSQVLVLVTASVAIPVLLYVAVEQPLNLGGHHIARRLLRTRSIDTPSPKPANPEAADLPVPQ
jgi:peptidoglycan/LPS O-acetylase OafA/YrhL